MTEDRNAQCSGWHGHMKMLVRLCPEAAIWEILVNLSVVALTCYEVYCLGRPSLREQLVLPNEKT